MSKPASLAVKLFGEEFANPVWSASGTYGYGRDYLDFIRPEELGAVVTKGTSLHPWSGNRPPRLCETPAGMLNSIGLQNPGIDYFLEHDLPWLRDRGAKVIVNVAGHTPQEYIQVVEKCQGQTGIAALEVNISCPNVKEGGLAFGTDPDTAHDLISRVSQVSQLPLIVKLSPNVTDITLIAQAVEAAGADAVSLINTLTGMVIDVNTARPVLDNVVGGLSGPAIRPIAVRMVWQVSQAVRIPVIGIGGILNAEDALQFFMAGASAVQVGTALFVDPEAPLKIIRGLTNYLEQKGYHSITEVIGLAWKGDNHD